jgi:hypothetical protein
LAVSNTDITRAPTLRNPAAKEMRIARVRSSLVGWRLPSAQARTTRNSSTLQWATYFDAADDAGISRLYMGIHISPDDFQGRRMGSTCGKDAWALAQRYFDESARS